MRATINAEGFFEIPKEFQDKDHLTPGDVFEIRRVGSGQYLLEKENKPLKSVIVTIESDGLPVIRGGGVITSEMVKEIEAKAP